MIFFNLDVCAIVFLNAFVMNFVMKLLLLNQSIFFFNRRMFIKSKDNCILKMFYLYTFLLFKLLSRFLSKALMLNLL